MAKTHFPKKRFLSRTGNRGDLRRGAIVAPSTMRQLRRLVPQRSGHGTYAANDLRPVPPVSASACFGQYDVGLRPCYFCTTRCPQEIPITDVMYTLKRMSIAQRMYDDTDAPALAKAFTDFVDRYCRSFELGRPPVITC